MKKLLILLTLIAGNAAYTMEDPSIIPNQQILYSHPNENITGEGNLNDYVRGGTPPYTFEMVGRTPGDFQLQPDGQFRFIPTRFPGAFQYTVIDAEGTRVPGSVIIKAEGQKG